MTGTYTGQFVMSGFINLHLRQWQRITITRAVRALNMPWAAQGLLTLHLRQGAAHCRVARICQLTIGSLQCLFPPGWPALRR